MVGVVMIDGVAGALLAGAVFDAIPSLKTGVSVCGDDARFDAGVSLAGDVGFAVVVWVRAPERTPSSLPVLSIVVAAAAFLGTLSVSPPLADAASGRGNGQEGSAEGRLADSFAAAAFFSAFAVAPVAPAYADFFGIT